MKTLKTEQFKSPRDLTEFVNEDSNIEVVSITSHQIKVSAGIRAEPQPKTVYRLFYYDFLTRKRKFCSYFSD
jgi:hypothetical protein